MDERNELMQAVKARAFAARVSLYAVATAAGVSGTVITRWIKGAYTPSLKTIGRFEKALDQIEGEKM